MFPRFNTCRANVAMLHCEQRARSVAAYSSRLRLPQGRAVVVAADDELLRVYELPLVVLLPCHTDDVEDGGADGEAIGLLGAGERVVPHRVIQFVREAGGVARGSPGGHGT